MTILLDKGFWLEGSNKMGEVADMISIDSAGISTHEMTWNPTLFALSDSRIGRSMEALFRRLTSQFQRSENDQPYRLTRRIEYYSPRYNRWVHVPVGRRSDGATGAKDLHGDVECTKNGEPYMASASWWVHDELCLLGKWHDGTKCTNWQASMVLRDILKAEGHGFRSRTWTWATFALGGGKARENRH